MGPRVTLDPEKLIAVDTQAVIDYLTSQLALQYAALTSTAAKWSAVTHELSKTIDTAHTTYLNQSSAKKTQKDLSEAANSDTDNE